MAVGVSDRREASTSNAHTAYGAQKKTSVC